MPNIVAIVPAHAPAKDQTGNSAACTDFKAAFEYLWLQVATKSAKSGGVYGRVGSSVRGFRERVEARHT